MAQKQQEVATLRKALDKERRAVRSALDEVANLRAALDGERSAVRALRRDLTSQIKKVRDEEAEKYTTLVEQLKEKSSLEQEEALKNQKENLQKTITAEYQRLQQSREAELHREATRKEEDLRRQLRDALNRLNELINITNNSVHPTTATSSNTNTSATSATINSNEFQACRAQNKQLELRVQELIEAERRNADQIRTQHEEHLSKEAELQKLSRRETHILLEKLKCKDRTIELLQKELRKLKGRLEASCRNHPDIEKPGEPPRIGIKKRLALKTNGSSGETARTRCDPIKETNSNESTDQHSSCDNSNSTLQETETQEKGPTDDKKTETITNNGNNNDKDDEKEKSSVANDLGHTPSPSTADADIAINSWTKAVGLETLYQVVVAEHQELQRAHQALAAKLKVEQKARADLESSIQQNRSENPINLALAAQIQDLTARQAELISENHDLREQNDLLEFRLLEIDSAPSSLHFKTPSSPSRSPESRGDREVDDISDSGVLSLPTSEDISETDFHELAMEPCNRDIKSKLSHLCQSIENISDRISIQQGLALLRHYETRLEAMLANMSPDLNKNANLSDMPMLTPDSNKSQSRIIATVLPFTDLSQTNGKQKDELPMKKLLKDVDCLQESGIFEESPEYCTRWTQTDLNPDKLEATPGDLSLEIRKLKQIRERIEEQGGNKRLLKTPGEEDHCQNAEIKELLFYRDRVELLENKIAIYESSGDDQIRRLNMRLEKEILLSAQVKHLKERCKYLEELNRRLEEEKCEFEEAENDTRLRCQKLEVKLSALGEKKSDLQVQLQQNARTMANLKSCLAEEEKKRIEARQHASQMESLVQCYEQRNFELEEKEMEARCRYQTIEGTIPALMAYNTWKITENKAPNIQNNNNNREKNTEMLPLCAPPTTPSSVTSESSSTTENSSEIKIAKDLYSSLRSLEKDISQDFKKLEQSKSIEQSLREKVRTLECTIKNKVEGGLTREHKEELCDQLKLLNKEKIELENRVKDLELKEQYYKQTLQAADGMWASMEQEYKDQIRQFECRLEEKQKELQDVEKLVSKLCSEKEHKKCLQERVCCLESEIKDLNFKLAEREIEKRHFEKEEHRLCCELATTSEELNYVRNCVEPCLKQQVEDYKRMLKDLKKEVKELERERETDMEDRHIEVSGLKRKINSLSKEILENECTISELREEVQTLEAAVNELREKFLEEQDSRERLIIKMTAEIEDKDREITLLRKKSTKLPKSAREELEEAEKSQNIFNGHQPCNEKRSKSHRKHRAKCHLTLKKLNEKIKAGLLVDEDQLNSFSCGSSGDDSCSESLQSTLDFHTISSSNISPDRRNFVNNLCDTDLDNKMEEIFSGTENKIESLKGENENTPLRLPDCIIEDDSNVDGESTDLVASSQTSQDRSSSQIEESIHEQKVLAIENSAENASPTQRLNSAIKHSTTKTKTIQTEPVDIDSDKEHHENRKPVKKLKTELPDVSPELPLQNSLSPELPLQNSLSPELPNTPAASLLSNETPTFSYPVHNIKLNEELEEHQSNMKHDSEISINEEFHSSTSIDIKQDPNVAELPKAGESKSDRTPELPNKINSSTIDNGLLKPTISSLLSTIQTLQSKISSKDQLIQCLADELISLAENGCCWKNSLFACIASYPSKRCVDFDCALLVDYLAGFIYFRPDPSNQYLQVEGPVSETENHPLNLKVVGATSFDSLLISWKIPQECVNQVSGFDIYVNDELVERIRDSEARRTLLHPVDMQQQILVTVCALDKCGVHLLCDNICIPPVSAIEGGPHNTSELLVKFQSPNIESSHLIDEQELHSEMYGVADEQPIQDELSQMTDKTPSQISASGMADQQTINTNSSRTIEDQPPQKKLSYIVEE